MAHTDKGPLQKKKVPLQTRGPYSDKGPLQTLCISTDKGPLQTKDPYIIYMQGCKGLLQTKAHSCKHIYTLYTDKGPIQVCRKTLKTIAHPHGGPYRKSDITEKGSLHRKGPYRQGSLQTRGPYR